MRQHQQQQGFGAPIQVWGDRAKFHAERHMAKLKICPFDCGIDIYPSRIISCDMIGDGKSVMSIGTDLHMNTAVGSFLWLTSRSSTIEKMRGNLLIDGKIDAGYEGEILVRILCFGVDSDLRSDIEAFIQQDLAIAQVIPQLYCLPQFVGPVPKGVIVPARGNGGFGSTDRR